MLRACLCVELAARAPAAELQQLEGLKQDDCDEDATEDEYDE